MTLAPTTDHLTYQLKQQREKESRLLSELAECQNLIASHLKTIELIEEYEHSQTKPDNQGADSIL